MKEGIPLENRRFTALKIIITVISLICALLFKSDIDWANLSNNYINMTLVKEILYDLSIGIFSAMVLVWFIDEIGSRIQERKSREKELNIIARFNKVILLYINQYIDLFYCTVTPLENRDPENVKLTVDFTLKDMRDLYYPSARLNEKLYGASVEAFLRVEHELREKFMHIIESHDFEHYPEISGTLLRFVEFSLTFDSRVAILDAYNKTLKSESDNEGQDIKMTTYIHDWLEKEADQYFQKNLDKTNVIVNPLHFPYISLYQMMRHERECILQYLDEIKRLGI